MRPATPALRRLRTRAPSLLCGALVFLGGPALAQDPPPTGGALGTVAQGRLLVSEKSGLAIRVLVDGVDRGVAPLTIDLPPGSYEVSGIGSTLVAAPQQVRVESAAPAEIVLEAVPATARVEVRTSDGKGTIFIDARSVGQGEFIGQLPVGDHVVRVEREGFEPYEKAIRLGHRQVLVESVTLEQRASTKVAAGGQSYRVPDGLYGGVQLGLALMPAGSDHSLDTGCDSLGATSCDGSKPWGVGFNGYVGYAIAPVGFELLFGVLGDRASPQAHFDGVHGSSINPLVAQPARDEEFQIYRAGALGAVRVRGSLDTSSVRLSAALGAGVSWKKAGMKRTVTTTDGTDATNEFVPESVSYWSPGVTLDVGVQVPAGETTMLAAGVWLWAETARDEARTAPESDRVISSGATPGPPRPLATPAYDLANGDQIYVGPYVGLQFGP